VFLYTLDHYRAVQRRLSDSGIFAQWLPLWQLGRDELELIGNSLHAAFPYTSVWLDDTDPKRALLRVPTRGVPRTAQRTRSTLIDRHQIARVSGPPLRSIR
jgi:hypothetical protein